MINTIDYQTTTAPGSCDPSALAAALAAISGMEPQRDGNGNLQAVYRLDRNEDDSYTVTFPAAVDKAAVDAVIASDPEPPPQAPFDPLVPASVAVQTAVAAAMATVAITSPNLTPSQKTTIQAQVQSAVQAVVDEHLGGST